MSRRVYRAHLRLFLQRLLKKVEASSNRSGDGTLLGLPVESCVVFTSRAAQAVPQFPRPAPYRGPGFLQRVT